MKKRKILILANSSGGLYDFRNELVTKLLEEYQVTVSLPDEVRTKELSEEGCKVIYTPINRRGVNPLEDFKLLQNYRRLIKQETPDLILTYTIKPNIYGGFCSRFMKIPYISTVTGLGSTFQRKGMLLKMIVAMYRVGLKKAECIFFQNEENKKIFEKYNIKGKDSRLVSGSGVNLKRHTFEPYHEGDEIHFLFVGRMMKEKGIEELLSAAKELHGQKVIFDLLGYCDEDYQDRLNAEEKDGVIKKLGFDPDVHEYIKNCSALILPTYHEGMSNVLMEASATGRPVIASNISGCKEIFEEDVTGFGCEPKSSEDLIRAIRKFLALNVEERAAMGRNARAKMEREFDRNKVVGVYINEINEVLQNR
ncbi:MAG: glycosyltransferase family 4 protein [Lachnospiraceae bacterium]|nr:glycosyltransferase family 4 protein [Lachnospiraceae bacterium]